MNRAALEAANAAALAAAPVLHPMQFPVAPSLSDMSIGSWQPVECKEEPKEEPADAPTTPVPKKDNKRPPPVPKGPAGRELEAQAIEERASHGSAAMRQSNMA